MAQIHIIPDKMKIIVFLWLTICLSTVKTCGNNFTLIRPLLDNPTPCERNPSIKKTKVEYETETEKLVITVPPQLSSLSAAEFAILESYHNFLLESPNTELDKNHTPRYAPKAQCDVYEVTVDIVRSQDKNPDIHYVPICAKLSKCGGLCQNAKRICMPIEKREKNITITEVTWKSGLYDSRNIIITLEEHTRCNCDCPFESILRCNRLKGFVHLDYDCKCPCKDWREIRKCAKKKFHKWDESTCTCECDDPNVNNCTIGMHYDYDMCKCVISPKSEDVPG